MPFNPVEHPICLATPDRIVESAWLQHTPFAMLLIDLLRPRLVVELGVGSGALYCAFCQAVDALNAPCRCVGVDTWQDAARANDAGTIRDGADVLADLRAYHDPRYASFSTLLQSPSDDVVAQFEDGSIDLLRLDGVHTDEAARHDFETWAPKLSERGVVVLHGTAERDGDAGVYTLWDELKARYPRHLEVHQGHGLGVLVVGSVTPTGLDELLDLTSDEFAQVERLFADLGERIEALQTVARMRQEMARREAESSRSEQRARQSYTDLTRDLLATSRDSEGKAVDLNRRLQRAESELSALDNSRGVRLIKLARASRMVLSAQGPLEMAKQVALWLAGKRGSSLRELNIQNGIISLPDAAYHSWFMQRRVTPGQLAKQREQAKAFAIRPLISIVTQVDAPDPRTLRATIESALAQSYDNWELRLVESGSSSPEARDVLRQFVSRDARIHLMPLDENLDASNASSASNAALRLAQGEFVALLDCDALIEPDLLFEVVQALNATEQADVLYVDEDQVSADGKHFERPAFKPDWSPELLLSAPFPARSVIRRQLLLDIGGFDPAADGAQVWDLLLRLSERTSRFIHLPRVLYHQRMADSGAEPAETPQVWEQRRLAVQRHMRRLGHPDAQALLAAPGSLRVVWKSEPKRVSIIIPTKDKVAMLRRCLTSIQALTAYEDYDIVLVDTGSVEQATEDYYTSLADEGVTIVRYTGEFNFSRACNVGARHASGDLLLFLNNDVEVIDEDWLEELARWASMPEIGVVGAKLLYPDGRIQHAGVTLGVSGLAAHLWYDSDDHITSLFGSVDWYRDLSAVTGALHMMRREVYEAVGGYDEDYHISYSDVAFCVEAQKLGYRVLFDPFVRLIHYESQTRVRTPSPHDTQMAGERMRAQIEAGDPYYNPNLSSVTFTPTLRAATEASRAQLLARLIESTGVKPATLASKQ